MPFTLPAWFDLDAGQLRVESGLEPHQLQATANDAAMESTITGHILTAAARVLGEARIAAGHLSFPSTDAELIKAFPVEIEFPVLIAHDSSGGQQERARKIVKADAYELWVPAHVILKFPFQIGNPDDQAVPSQDAITEAVEAAEAARASHIEEQKQLAMQATASLVFAKLWYSSANPGNDHRVVADGHWKTGMSLISTLKANIAQVRAQHQMNSCPFV